MASSLRNDPAAALAWTRRAVGFGSTTEDLDLAEGRTTDELLDELFEAATEPAAVPLFDGLDLPLRPEGAEVARMVGAWLLRMATGRSPVRDWLTWFWHGHLVTSFRVVRSPKLLSGQLRTYDELGGGPFRALLRATTIDPAMLVYLDGARSTGTAPNENYARELLELFALGLPVGDEAWTETDVERISASLTGWTLDRRDGSRSFVPTRHDDTRRRVLGVDDVHDLDTVIDAVVGHPQCAVHVTRCLASSILGPGVAESLVEDEAERFARDGLVVLPLIRRLVEAGIDGARTETPLGPVAWFANAYAATAPTRSDGLARGFLEPSGQIPMAPPDVAGWPSPEAWLTTSATAARLTTAIGLAEAASDTAPLTVAAGTGDLDAVARSIGRPQGLSPTTIETLERSGATDRALMALVLSAPDLMVNR